MGQRVLLSVTYVFIQLLGSSRLSTPVIRVKLRGAENTTNPTLHFYSNRHANVPYFTYKLSSLHLFLGLFFLLYL